MKIDLTSAPVREDPPLPDKCCGRCEHGRPYFESSVMKTMIVCKAGPPSVVVMHTPQGVGIQSKWPTLDRTSDCDAFEKRSETVS